MLMDSSSYFTAFKEVSIQKQEEIHQEIKDVKNLLRRVLDIQTPSTTASSRNHQYPSLPLRSEEELKITEQLIEDKEQYLKLVIEKLLLTFSRALLRCVF